MATFRDKKNREWVLDLDVHQVEQVEKRVEGVRIDHLLADKFAGLTALFEDAVKFVRVLWVLVEERASKLAIEPEDFGRALGGDSLEAAGNAFVQALADFSPRQQRSILNALLARGKELATEQTASVLKEIADFNPAKPPAPSTPATSAAGSSDSIPAGAG